MSELSCLHGSEEYETRIDEHTNALHTACCHTRQSVRNRIWGQTTYI